MNEWFYHYQKNVYYTKSVDRCVILVILSADIFIFVFSLLLRFTEDTFDPEQPATIGMV